MTKYTLIYTGHDIASNLFLLLNYVNVNDEEIETLRHMYGNDLIVNEEAKIIAVDTYTIYVDMVTHYA